MSDVLKKHIFVGLPDEAQGFVTMVSEISETEVERFSSEETSNSRIIQRILSTSNGEKSALV